VAKLCNKFVESDQHARVCLGFPPSPINFVVRNPIDRCFQTVEELGGQRRPLLLREFRCFRNNFFEFHDNHIVRMPDDRCHDVFSANRPSSGTTGQGRPNRTNGFKLPSRAVTAAAPKGQVGQNTGPASGHSDRFNSLCGLTPRKTIPSPMGTKRTGFMMGAGLLERNGFEFYATEAEAVLQTLALQRWLPGK
jgi:hypothetical protein